MSNEPPRRRSRAVYLWLAAPYLIYAWVPFYNRAGPPLWGIPFFYWWQIAGIFVTSLCILPVYWHEQGGRK